MGKRSTFERKARDFYPTPYEAVLPLLPHLPDGVVFDEPGMVLKFKSNMPAPKNPWRYQNDY